LISLLLYAVYRYQHILFTGPLQLGFGSQSTPESDHNSHLQYSSNKSSNLKPISHYKPQNITADNISQVSLGSLDDEDGKIFSKQDSLLGSVDFDNNSLDLSDVSYNDNQSLSSQDSLFV
jgi:hypothetical protein